MDRSRQTRAVQSRLSRGTPILNYLLVAVLFVACSRSSPPDVFTDEVSGFAVTKPAGWFMQSGVVLKAQARDEARRFKDPQFGPRPDGSPVQAVTRITRYEPGKAPRTNPTIVVVRFDLHQFPPGTTPDALLKMGVATANPEGEAVTVTPQHLADEKARHAVAGSLRAATLKSTALAVVKVEQRRKLSDTADQQEAARSKRRGVGLRGEPPMDKEAMNVASVEIRKEKQSRRGGSRDGLFQRNGWWWLDYYDAEGKRHRKKAAPDYTTAKLIYRQTMTAIARGEVLGVREEGLRLKEFVERIWWPRTKLRLAPAWAERVKAWCLDSVILPRFGAFKLLGLRKDTIEAWATERIGSVSASTFNKELWTVKNICKCAVDWGYMKASPAQDGKRLKEPNGRVRYLTAEERETLIREANATLRLYIVAALQTGARRSELVRLRWKDVDFKTRTVRFTNTKNGDSRAVPMTDTLSDLIQGFARPLDPEAPVFPEREPLAHPELCSTDPAPRAQGPHLSRPTPRRREYPRHGRRPPPHGS